MPLLISKVQQARQGETLLTLMSGELEDKMIRRGLEALMAALEPVETVRFLTLPRRRRLESVRRHRQWQASLEQEGFFAQVFGARDEQGAL